MPTGATKRQLSNSKTPSPGVKKAAKALKMDGKLPDTGFDTGNSVGTLASQEFKNNSFELVFGCSEEHVMNMKDETERWHFMMSALKKCAQKIDNLDNLEKKNNELKYMIQSARGKINRLEKDLERAQKKLIDMECRSLKKNAVFYNLEESQKEDCIKVVYDFLEQELGINIDLLCRPSNPKGTVEIDSAYRLGIHKKKPRPLVVKFTTTPAKELVASHYRLNKHNTRIRMSDHFPPEIKEKRTAQVGDLKQFRELYKDTNTKVRLIQDKLKVGSQIVENSFETNKLRSSPASTVPSVNSISHTDIVVLQDSHFQGHACNVKSVKEAAGIRDALFQSNQVANSHHVMYAYVLTDESGMTISGHSDDGEWSASKLILNLIKENKQSNVFVAVSRRHDGPNLGPQRFTIISSVASKALSMV